MSKGEQIPKAEVSNLFKDPRPSKEKLDTTAVIVRTAPPTFFLLHHERLNVDMPMNHIAWFNKWMPRLICNVEVYRVDVDQLPRELRQRFKYGSSFNKSRINPKHYGLGQEQFDGGFCVELWSDKPCPAGKDCNWRHLPPGKKFILSCLRRGGAAEKFVFNLIRTFIRRYPDWDTGKGPEHPCFSRGTRSTNLPKTLPAFNYIPEDGLDDTPLAPLIKHFDDLENAALWEKQPTKDTWFTSPRASRTTTVPPATQTSIAASAATSACTVKQLRI